MASETICPRKSISSWDRPGVTRAILGTGHVWAVEALVGGVVQASNGLVGFADRIAGGFDGGIVARVVGWAEAYT